MTAKPEAWQRGPVEGVPALLQPVAHALLNAQEQVEEAIRDLTPQQLATRPNGAASIEYHVRHAIGSLDRLFTYARGESLTDDQRAYLKAEVSPLEGGISPGDLFTMLQRGISKAIEQLRHTDESALTEPREIGRAKLPSTAIGLLFHGGEHTARHAGQVVTTAKIVRGTAS
ncbi:MAG TPA: DinB family protein [Gemmatimonadaceae bacterium]